MEINLHLVSEGVVAIDFPSLSEGVVETDLPYHSVKVWWK